MRPNARDHLSAANRRGLCSTAAKAVTDQARQRASRSYVASELVPADVQRAMKDAEHIDIPIVLDQVMR